MTAFPMFFVAVNLLFIYRSLTLFFKLILLAALYHAPQRSNPTTIYKRVARHLRVFCQCPTKQVRAGQIPALRKAQQKLASRQETVRTSFLILV